LQYSLIKQIAVSKALPYKLYQTLHRITAEKTHEQIGPDRRRREIGLVCSLTQLEEDVCEKEDSGLGKGGLL
jgi:hypothetical protein